MLSFLKFRCTNNLTKELFPVTESNKKQSQQLTRLPTLVQRKNTQLYRVWSVAVLINQSLASGDAIGMIKIWNSTDGSLIRTINAHSLSCGNERRATGEC